ncbi:type II toxin-antitoxin system HicB family antitoxin [Fusobacterium simiae]|uniref:Type II toxin-antitoxin system HicB family antitoxin n=1 Tax=Fusobacterium simiae TaxID=855 RepID=A0ABT4DF23_FUSSI|nr:MULTISPECIES: type II toxin-antitoxin system HicB family antitoxin [Fusobacterium]MCY7007194.1 type II toxin-antitoxin system HicB family antitoxin [Fusobacterium simiae]MDC7955596.1 type II toxin-antitoxin system HicB family antitoxin [Fusobacterium simiae]
MATINYIVVVKQLESGKFLISFPDFEGITTTAETEENIQNAALGVIKAKLAELKKANIEAPEPKKMMEVSKELKDGEFTTYVAVKESFDFKTTMTSLKDKESIKESAKEVTNKVNDFVNNIPQGKENLFGIGGGVLSILNTLFLAVVTIKLPFFGDYKIKFFQGLSGLADFSKEIKNAQLILIFSGILFLALAGLLIYSSFIKNRNILKYSIFGNIAFLIIFYIVLYVRLPGGEPRKYISVSYFKILLYIISIGLAYLTYDILNKKKDVIEENIKPLGSVLEKEENEEEKSE